MSYAQSIDGLNIKVTTGKVAQSIDSLDILLSTSKGAVQEGIILLSPSNGELNVSVTPSFDWNSSTTYDAYKILIDADDTFSSPIEAYVTQTDFSQTTALLSATGYFWKVVGGSVTDRPAIVPSTAGKDSVQGDFEALQALYIATQGDDSEIPTLSTTNDLPTNTANASYPYMYMINGEIHYLEYDRDNRSFQEGFTANWINDGTPWFDKTGWENMTPETMGDAIGVTTDANGRVIELDLWRVKFTDHGSGRISYEGNTLVGKLPPEINNLKKITYLAVKQNCLFGKIPDISGLKLLDEVSFAGQDSYLRYDDRNQWHEANHWAGLNIAGGKKVVAKARFLTDIPEFNDCPNLKLVELRHSFLTGTVPDWTNCPSMTAIFLDSSKDPDDISTRVSGTLPDSWGNLISTVFFCIGGLNLSGDFPQTINDNWENLAKISIGGNSFTGPVPEFLKSRDKRYITIGGGNQFTGGFPSGYFNGDNSLMTKWQIGDLFLGGELPQTVPAPTYPTSRANYAIDAPGIGYNNFSGELPRWYQTMLGMQTFFIRGNQFSGPFPDGLMDQDNLKTFYGDSNNFSGPLPDKQWGNRAIPWFYMNGNSYTGEVPDSWISLFQSDAGNWYTNYQRVYWNDNELSGRIPTWIINTGASHFSIQNNRYTFKDIIPVYDVLNNNIPAFSVFPQKPFGVEQNPIIPVGDSITFDLSEFNYAGNSYQWEKDGVDISGATSSTYSVTNAQESDSGVYKLKVTNSNLPELGTHESQIIDLIVGEDPNEVPQTP